MMIRTSSSRRTTQLSTALSPYFEAAPTVPAHLHLMSSSHNPPYNPLLAAVKGTSTMCGSSSSASLLDPSVSQGAPLRKSSSALDWSILADFNRDHPSFHNLSERPGVFLENGRKKSSQHFGFPALSLLAAHREDPAGGLVMSSGTGAASSTVVAERKPSMFGASSSTTTASGSTSLVAAASAALHHSPSTAGALSTTNATSTNPLMPSPSASTKSAPPLETAKLTETASVTGASQEHKHGMLGSVFKSGFLGRPVLRTEEESYRYIMALDR